jgi:putative zinc finger protein
MPEDPKDGMPCSEFEALLSEALDGQLSAEKRESFQAHAGACAVCGPLLSEAETGRLMLKELVEVEPPRNLIHNILASTTGIETARLRAPMAAQGERSFGDRLRALADRLASPLFGLIRQPRFVMSFGMAFFSLTFAMSVAGVKVTDLKQVDLRPSALKRIYYTTTGRIVKYYENIRFVYEIESRVRELKRATTPAEPGPNKKQENRRNNNTSEQPDQNKEQNYSWQENQPVLAFVTEDPTVVTGTTHRRDA